ncbi:MAG: POTRA domain-containing protein [Pirellulales bacterium]
MGFSGRHTEPSTGGLLRTGVAIAVLRLAVAVSPALLATSLAVAQLAPETRPQIAEIRFVGNRIYSDTEIRDQISTVAGRTFDQQAVERDVRTLLTSGQFFDVNVKTSPGPAPDTVIVFFEVVEYPKVRYVRFVGNDKLNDGSLRKKVGIAVGDPADTSRVRRAKEELEAHYRSKGFNKARIEIHEGLERTDAGVVFLIEEGPSQKVWSVDFVGNSIASDARLKTQIESKPPIGKHIFRGFKGFVDTKTIDEDLDRLTAYYRSLGFFDAKIGRELQYDDDGDWLNITFVIHEGPRYKIRDISFAGNQVYRTEQLAPLLELETDEYYDQSKMDKDVNSLVEAYGAEGYIYADIQASPRYLEPGVMDLVYEIGEGERYRVGRILVNIVGDSAHTSHTTVLNRISLQPGQIVDIREVRASERRIMSSNLFNRDPTAGPAPKISFKKRDSDTLNADNRREPQVRGQSPEMDPAEIDLWVYPDPRPPASLPTPHSPVPPEGLPAATHIYGPRYAPRMLSPSADSPNAARFIDRSTQDAAGRHP